MYADLVNCGLFMLDLDILFWIIWVYLVQIVIGQGIWNLILKESKFLHIHFLWINWNCIMSNCLESVLYFPSAVNNMSFQHRLLILLWNYPHMICVLSNAIAVGAETAVVHHTNTTPAALLLATKVRLSPNLLLICDHNALVSPNGFKCHTFVCLWTRIHITAAQNWDAPCAWMWIVPGIWLSGKECI